MERACVGATCSQASSFVVAARLGTLFVLPNMRLQLAGPPTK